MSRSIAQKQQVKQHRIKW